MNRLLLLILFGITTVYTLQFIRYKPHKSGTYIEQLGGTNTQTVALIDAREYIGDEEVFSMYATGLEVVKNQFQPTGYDYIIHALGDDVQKKYAKDFVEGDYKYVQTPSMEVGSWVAQQNWYLYRHILKNYSMEFQTEYSFIWRKTNSNKIEADVQVEVIKIDDCTAKIICISDNVDTFVADLNICYSTSFGNLLTRLLCLNKKAVTVHTTCCGYDSSYYGLALPEEGNQYIPVKMENGKGEAIIKGAYGDNILLNIISVEYIQSLPAFTLQLD